MKSFDGYLKLKLGNDYILLAGGSHKTISDFLLRSGGQMTGPLTWSGGTALPERSTVDYIVCIDAFTDGGTTKWASINTLKTSLGLGSNAYTSTAYLPLSGGTITGIINRDSGGSWISARDNVIIKTTRTSGEGSDWHPAVGIKTSAGFWSFGSVGGEHLGFSYDTDANYLTGNNDSTVISMPLKTGTIALTSDLSSYLPLSGSTLAANNSWLSPAQLQLLRYDTTSYTDRACIGVTDGNLHLDSYPSHDIYLNYYSGNATVHIGNYTAIHSGNIGSLSVNYATSAGHANQLQAFVNDDFTNGDHFIKAIRDPNGWAMRLWTCYNGGAKQSTAVYVGYADSAGNADTVDNIHATGFLRWKCMENIGSDSPFLSSVDYFNNLSNLNDGGTLVYNPAGTEYTILFTRRNDSTSHGSILKWGYADNYIRIIRMLSGTARSTDWEKISAGYADSAGSASVLTYTGTSNGVISAAQTPDSFMGRSGWASYIICNHGDGATYYSQTIALPFYGPPMYRRLENGTDMGWMSFITSENIGSLSVNYATSAGNADTVDSEHASAFAHIGAHNDLTASGNEFTTASSGFSGGYWWNYRTAGGANGNITAYYFGNGSGGTLASITSGTFNGNCTGSAGYASRAAYLDGHGVSPDNSHPGYGARVFYSWNSGQAYNSASGYSNGITIGSHPDDQSYGFQIVQNMWDDNTYTRRYNGGWQDWKTLLNNTNYPSYIDGRYLRYEGWWSSGSGQNIDNAEGMNFVYSDHGSPSGWGILSTFSFERESGYKMQLFSNGYIDGYTYYRNKSNDRGGWGSWVRILDSTNWTSIVDGRYLPLSGGTMTVSRGSNGITDTIKAYCSSTLAGDSVTFRLGKESSSGNCALFIYYYAGSGSTSNLLEIGFNGNYQILNLTYGGNVGIGTTSPSYKLHVNGNCGATNFYTTSDRTKKQNISSFSEHIRKFQLKATKKWHYGVIAQEVEEMFRDGEEGNMTVNYNSVLSYYIGILENKINLLELKIKYLENK